MICLSVEALKPLNSLLDSLSHFLHYFVSFNRWTFLCAFFFIRWLIAFRLFLMLVTSAIEYDRKIVRFLLWFLIGRPKCAFILSKSIRYDSILITTKWNPYFVVYKVHRLLNDSVIMTHIRLMNIFNLITHNFDGSFFFLIFSVSIRRYNDDCWWCGHLSNRKRRKKIQVS